jgi:hypothetical protein
MCCNNNLCNGNDDVENKTEVHKAKTVGYKEEWLADKPGSKNQDIALLNNPEKKKHL